MYTYLCKLLYIEDISAKLPCLQKSVDRGDGLRVVSGSFAHLARTQRVLGAQSERGWREVRRQTYVGPSGEWFSLARLDSSSCRLFSQSVQTALTGRRVDGEKTKQSGQCVTGNPPNVRSHRMGKSAKAIVSHLPDAPPSHSNINHTLDTLV